LQNARADVDDHDEKVEGTLKIDMYAGLVKAHLRGFILPHRVDGVYRSLDLAIIEEYSDKFTLARPAWGDCIFEVGFDKFRNIFTFQIDISTTKGTYCGVPFDAMHGTIKCRGIWDAVTIIEPISVRRNGESLATGKITFDCIEDKFKFEAYSTALTPTEALKIIDMPFIEVIPPMSSETPPEINIRGQLPLLSEQTPEKVVLAGSVTSKSPFTFDQVTLESVDALLSMQQGTFSIDALKGTFLNNGTVEGRVDIHIPNVSTYADIAADVTLHKASLADLLQPFHMETLTNCVATGNIQMACRADDTFKSSIRAAFDVVIDGGLIGRVPLFAGFTDLMAEKVPGVAKITDTSTVHLKGSAEKGIFTLPHFTLSGSLFMIEGPVTYDLPNDLLGAKVIAGIFKKNTVIGNITRWATIPVTKMLWQVEVTGPLNNPQWRLITLINKLWDYVPLSTKESTTL
jgi:hypothetical protein